MADVEGNEVTDYEEVVRLRTKLAEVLQQGDELRAERDAVEMKLRLDLVAMTKERDFYRQDDLRAEIAAVRKMRDWMKDQLVKVTKELEAAQQFKDALVSVNAELAALKDELAMFRKTDARTT
jgi:seryl-tRNA synthetase